MAQEDGGLGCWTPLGQGATDKVVLQLCSFLPPFRPSHHQLTSRCPCSHSHQAPGPVLGASRHTEQGRAGKADRRGPGGGGWPGLPRPWLGDSALGARCREDGRDRATSVAVGGGGGRWAGWTGVARKSKAQLPTKTARPTGSGGGPDGGRCQAWVQGPWACIQAAVTSWPGDRGLGCPRGRPGLPQLCRHDPLETSVYWAPLCSAPQLPAHICPGRPPGAPLLLQAPQRPPKSLLDTVSHAVWPAQTSSQHRYSQGPEATKPAPYLPRASLAQAGSQQVRPEGGQGRPTEKGRREDGVS